MNVSLPTAKYIRKPVAYSRLWLFKCPSLCLCKQNHRSVTGKVLHSTKQPLGKCPKAFPKRLLSVIQKTFIVAHQQLAFQCFYDIQANTNNDDQCCTTEAYIYLKDPLQNNRHHRQNRIADCTNQCYSVYDSCNVSACGLTGSDTGDETTAISFGLITMDV